VSHVYHITPDDLDRFETLEPSDVGRPYILVAGCIHFVDRARTVYLIHLNRPLAHARHYLGSTDDLERRLHEHLQGNGSKMLAAVARAGIPWRLARTKSCPKLLPGDRAWERRLHRYKKSRRLCPICSAGAHERMQKP
jgi:predicted GIY-YIG superfamily endonuclease